MSQLVKKNFDAADQTTQPSEKMKVDVMDINGTAFHRVTVQPGWRWTIDLKPVVKTDSCQMEHLHYMLSGSMHIKMDDGQEMDYGAGDVVAIPPGHDGWVTGDQPAVWLEIPR